MALRVGGAELSNFSPRMVGAAWRKFWSLEPPARRILRRAFTAVGVCRVALWFLPFRTLRGAVDWASGILPEDKSGCAKPEEIAWAVRVAGDYVPKSSCLVQALAAQFLLTRSGLPGCVRIGVAFNDQREFQAHAWVESDGTVLIGGNDSTGRYTPLLAWEGRRNGQS